MGLTINDDFDIVDADTGEIVPQPTVKNIEFVDGYLVDLDTGEILGVQEGPDFCVCDLKSAEWVLEKMQQEDAAIAGLQMRRQAILEQIEAMIRDRQRRRDWLEYRFGQELQNFTAMELAATSKGKSLKTPFGTMGFRLHPGSIKVRKEAEDYAIRWVEEHAPDAVKVTKSVLVTPLKGKEDELPLDLFDVTPAHDAFYIKTGVGK